jgi:trigger factor
MKASLEDISSVKKRLLVEIGAEEVKEKANGAYRELGKRAKIPGFRPGKIPRNILERYFGKEVLEDLKKDLVNETLPKAVEETKTFPLFMPIVESETLKIGQDFKYTAVMEVKPEFELKDYKGIEVEKEIYSVSDEDVERQLEEVRKTRGTLNSIDENRGIEEGEYAIIEYEGFEGEMPLEGIKAQNFLLQIGSNEFHPDFEKALIGLKKDDRAEIKVDFDADHYHPNLSGKSVNFKVKISDIKEMELPELNDEFARNLEADFTDLEDLKQKINEGIITREEKRVDRELKKRLLKKISDGVDFELPESLVESEIHYAIENIKQNLIRSGSNFEKAGLNEGKLTEKIRPSSENKVKEMLVLGEIARQNELTVNDMELAEGFKEMALNMGQDPEVLRKYHEDNNLEGSFRQGLLEEKTLNYLVKCATVQELEADKISSEQDKK